MIFIISILLHCGNGYIVNSNIQIKPIVKTSITRKTFLHLLGATAATAVIIPIQKTNALTQCDIEKNDNIRLNKENIRLREEVSNVELYWYLNDIVFFVMMSGMVLKT